MKRDKLLRVGLAAGVIAGVMAFTGCATPGNISNSAYRANGYNVNRDTDGYGYGYNYERENRNSALGNNALNGTRADKVLDDTPRVGGSLNSGNRVSNNLNSARRAQIQTARPYADDLTANTIRNRTFTRRNAASIPNTTGTNNVAAVQ
ncbi:hypothetical protein AGMMS49975_09300 [Clostridia bacterium]|nr:hypothetical protein AGMMS49975_09300 [Clostridia bacterium]